MNEVMVPATYFLGELGHKQDGSPSPKIRSNFGIQWYLKAHGLRSTHFVKTKVDLNA